MTTITKSEAGLYPFAQTATEAEVNSKLFQGACSVGKYGPASRAQIDYLAASSRRKRSRARPTSLASETWSFKNGKRQSSRKPARICRHG